MDVALSVSAVLLPFAPMFLTPIHENLLAVLAIELVLIVFAAGVFFHRGTAKSASVFHASVFLDTMKRCIDQRRSRIASTGFWLAALGFTMSLLGLSTFCFLCVAIACVRVLASDALRRVRAKGLLSYVPKGLHSLLLKKSLLDLLYEFWKYPSTSVHIQRMLYMAMFDLSREESAELFAGAPPKLVNTLKTKGLLRLLPSSTQALFFPSAEQAIAAADVAVAPTPPSPLTASVPSHKSLSRLSRTRTGKRSARQVDVISRIPPRLSWSAQSSLPTTQPSFPASGVAASASHNAEYASDNCSDDDAWTENDDISSSSSTSATSGSASGVAEASPRGAVERTLVFPALSPPSTFFSLAAVDAVSVATPPHVERIVMSAYSGDSTSLPDQAGVDEDDDPQSDFTDDEPSQGVSTETGEVVPLSEALSVQLSRQLRSQPQQTQTLLASPHMGRGKRLDLQRTVLKSLSGILMRRALRSSVLRSAATVDPTTLRTTAAVASTALLLQLAFSRRSRRWIGSLMLALSVLGLSAASVSAITMLVLRSRVAVESRTSNSSENAGQMPPISMLDHLRLLQRKFQRAVSPETGRQRSSSELLLLGGATTAAVGTSIAVTILLARLYRGKR